MKRKRKREVNFAVVRINLIHYTPEIDGALIVVTDSTRALELSAKNEHGANYDSLSVLQYNVDIRKYCSGVVKIRKEVDRGDPSDQ